MSCKNTNNKGEKTLPHSAIKAWVSIQWEKSSPCKKHFFSNNIEADDWSCESAIQGQFLK
jgi:hypothetical protein